MEKVVFNTSCSPFHFYLPSSKKSSNYIKKHTRDSTNGEKSPLNPHINKPNKKIIDKTKSEVFFMLFINCLIFYPNFEKSADLTQFLKR